MTDLEKAARMALEALGYYEVAGLATTRVAKSITALRQALSNSVEQPASKPWVGLTDAEIARVVSLAGFAPDWAEANIATQIVRVCQDMLKEKNTK